MNVLEVFTGNPFNTPVGQRIDKATDGTLPAEDWALNMEICDIISETDDGPKEAIRALRKKIVNNIGKDWKTVSYCLVVLETCVKNCGKRFHLQVASKEFLNDLVKILSPKNDPSVTVQEKVLALIQAWSDAFKGSPDLKAVEALYQDLKQKGVEFPPTDMDHMAPIHTPKSTFDSSHHTSPARPATQLPHRAGKYAKLEDDCDDDIMVTETQSAHQTRQPASAQTPAGSNMATLPTAEQMSKLRADIDIVQGNCRVFNEMLNVSTMNSSELSSDTVELMRELNRTCRQMQQRLVVLIEQLADEQVTEVLLRVNDDLNNAFLRYDRLEKSMNLSSGASGRGPAPPSSAHAAAGGAAAGGAAAGGAFGGAIPRQPASSAGAAAAAVGGAEESLIDFGGNSSVSRPPPVTASALAAHVDSIHLTPKSDISNVRNLPQARAEVDEFDMFAQSRKSDIRKQEVAASYAFQSEAADMRNSMATTGYNTGASDSAEYSATSSEFDKFLEERAVAGERLPDITTTNSKTDSSNHPTMPSRHPNRQMKDDDDDNNALFAL